MRTTLFTTAMTGCGDENDRAQRALGHGLLQHTRTHGVSCHSSTTPDSSLETTAILR